MGTYGKDYYENIEWLKKYAECEKVGNQLFLGVKGVGKSYLFKSYFTDEKIKELAERYKNIFVVTALNNRNKDSDIYSFIAGISFSKGYALFTGIIFDLISLFGA